MDTPSIDIKNLSLSFGENEILKNVSFSVGKGKILGVVGESGSGKSITSLAIMGLLPKNANLKPESKILFWAKRECGEDSIVECTCGVCSGGYCKKALFNYTFLV